MTGQDGEGLGAAVQLLNEALHLRQNGERAPGGTETWADWDRRAEAWLRADRQRVARCKP